MKRFNGLLFVVIYDIFLIIVIGVLIYLIREWWVLFLMLLSKSYTKEKKESEDSNEKNTTD